MLTSHQLLDVEVNVRQPPIEKEPMRLTRKKLKLEQVGRVIAS